MRSILLATAAVAALSAPAVAHGPNIYFVPGLTTFACVAGGVFGHTPQVQCATDYVAKSWHHGNDGNEQYIMQKQKASFPKAYGVWDTQQLQVGVNIVGNGDNNNQSIDQLQKLTDNTHHASDNVQQLQVGVNIVESGDNNTQGITQTQNLTIGSSGHHGGHDGGNS